jgi:putative ABC transport system permease protein
MFFLTYLRRELRRRMRQSVLSALGLAVGVGLVVAVTAASLGVKNAQAGVLRSLYGVGTDVTVTNRPPAFSPPKPGSGERSTFQVGPNGARICQNGKCHNAAGETEDHLSLPYQAMSASTVESVAKLQGVAAAAGGLTFTDNQIKLPAHFGQPGGGLPTPKSSNVDGVDISHPGLGPASSGTISSGRAFRAADADSAVAVVDSGYARAHKLTAGSHVTVAKTSFEIIGIIRQPRASNPPDIYLPLARAQKLSTGSGKLTGKVNAIYVTATSASAVASLQSRIQHLLPHATVTTSASLASQVTGSLASTARLANVLGRWLSILVLIAAFAVAGLLTLAAVARRVREFGTFKAIGWRSSRIILQVMGESAAVGVAGGAVGAGLGFAGAAVITAVAPKLSATLATSTGQHLLTVGGPGGAASVSPTVSHTVAVPLSASVSPGMIVLAVALAVGGGLLAGTAGSWRIARLRPADALAKVA